MIVGRPGIGFNHSQEIGEFAAVQQQGGPTATDYPLFNDLTPGPRQVGAGNFFEIFHQFKQLSLVYPASVPLHSRLFFLTNGGLSRLSRFPQFFEVDHLEQIILQQLLQRPGRADINSCAGERRNFAGLVRQRLDRSGAIMIKADRQSVLVKHHRVAFGSVKKHHTVKILPFKACQNPLDVDLAHIVPLKQARADRQGMGAHGQIGGHAVDIDFTAQAGHGSEQLHDRLKTGFFSTFSTADGAQHPAFGKDTAGFKAGGGVAQIPGETAFCKFFKHIRNDDFCGRYFFVERVCFGQETHFLSLR